MIAACTIGEGDYHYGVAALANSLFAHGYTGILSVGWRGPLPPWMSQTRANSRGVFNLNGVQIKFVNLNTDWMLANYKPLFMQEVLKDQNSEVGGVAYFDPDIVVECPWNRFEDWINNGIAVCRDNCFPVVSKNHWLRRRWLELLRQEKKDVSNFTESYFNSGFVGVSNDNRCVLEDWANLIEVSVKHGVDLTKFKQGDRWWHLQVPDQDLLNVALMLHPDEICELGTEGMSFSPGWKVLAHAVDNPKPWRRRYLSHFIRTGQSISFAHKQFWYYSQHGPIRAFSKTKSWLHLSDLRLASLLSRLLMTMLILSAHNSCHH